MANLYNLYDNGTFEGSYATLSFSAVRQNGLTTTTFGCGYAYSSNEVSFDGAKSLKIICSDAVIGTGPTWFRYAGLYPLRTFPGSPNAISLIAGKKYKIKGMVRVPSSSPIATNESLIMLGDFTTGKYSNEYSGLTSGQGTVTTISGNRKKITKSNTSTPGYFGLIETVAVKVVDALDQWVELECTWVEPPSSTSSGLQTLSIEIYKLGPSSNPLLDLTSGGAVTNQLIEDGAIYLDHVTLEEVIGCNLAYGSPAYTKTNESGVGANNGTVTVNATSSFAIQYRINSGAWQNSNVFTGLAPGTYTVDVQDLNGCSLSPLTGIQIFAFVPPTCNLVISSISTVNESGVGLNNGSATVNATSSAPSRLYSLDNVTFQSSNVFSPLAPNNYIAYVKNNDGGCLISQAFVIQPFAAPPIGGTLTWDKKPINSYNFISWFNVTGKIDFISISCVNQYWDLPKPYRLNKFPDKPKKHRPVVVNGERFSFYINFDQNYNYANFSSLRLDLISNAGLVQQSVGTLERVFAADGTTYFIYASVTLSGITIGDYRLAITDTSTAAPYNVLFITQEIAVMSSVDAPALTARFRFRASISMFRFLYYDIPDFFQEIRLEVNVLEEETDGEIDQYRAVTTGIIRNYAFDLNLFYKFETYYFDDLAHRAMFVFQVHDIIIINDRTFLVKSQYKIQWQQQKNVNKGTIELYDQAFSTINRYGNPDAIVITDPADVLGSDDGDVIGT